MIYRMRQLRQQIRSYRNPMVGDLIRKFYCNFELPEIKILSWTNARKSLK